VAVTAASNLIGTRPDLGAIADLVHEEGALLYVDAVHAAAHSPLDLATSGADFLVCSPYKFFGPHCGVLAARPDNLGRLATDKLLPSTDAVPERFCELGTLPYELWPAARRPSTSSPVSVHTTRQGAAVGCSRRWPLFNGTRTDGAPSST
jgi:hypothetical protein